MDKARQAVIRQLGARVQAYQRSADAFDDVVAAKLGLNRTDLRCLDWLSEGPRTVGQLARETGLSSAAATTLVDRLEARGLLRRVRDTADRRRILVELTDLALARIREIYGPLVTDGGVILKDMSDADLQLLSEWFERSTELTERHRRRLEGQ